MLVHVVLTGFPLKIVYVLAQNCFLIWFFKILRRYPVLPQKNMNRKGSYKNFFLNASKSFIGEINPY